MGNKVPSPLPSVQSATEAFSQEDYGILRRRFFDCCNKGTNVMSKASFFTTLSSKYNNVFDKAITSIFSIIDSKNNGFISFDDFICVVAIFRIGSDEDKARFLYLMYYDPKTGHISRPKMQDLVIDALVSEQFMKGVSLSMTDMHAWAVEQRAVTVDTIVDCLHFQYSKEDDKMSFSDFFAYMQSEECVKIYLLYLQGLFDVDTS